MKDTITILKTIKETEKAVTQWRKEGLTIGLVPTMGYLHRGHTSLIGKAAKENDKVIVSIFVNPMQFAPGEDLESYPRNMDRDRIICLDSGADVIFQPEPEEMYPEGFCTSVDLAGPASGLCGASRGGMFCGVATVVLKLLLITGATRAYFGQKDAQQLAVVRRMVRDLHVPVKIIGCTIVREDDGLALSSRNVYLSREERETACCLSRALAAASHLLKGGERDSRTIISAVRNTISTEPLAKIDYIEIVDPTSMSPIKKIESSALCALAVFIGRTRLIDNFLWEDEGSLYEVTTCI